MSMTPRRPASVLTAFVALALLASAPRAAPGAGVTVTRTDFHGWPAIVLRNRTAEIVVVPALTRVMQFTLRAPAAADGTTTTGPFWNHPRLSSLLKPDAEGWTNFGGDKAWPAPQSDWPRVAGRGWPPPRTFDALPATAKVTPTIGGPRVELLSGIDPAYGLRVRRTVALDARDAVMTIETTYEKRRGAPVRVAVWSITQLVSPDRLFIRLPVAPDFAAAFPGGFRKLLPDPPRDLRIVDDDLLSLAADPTKKTMIASAGDTLLWVGASVDLLIQVDPRQAAGNDTATWPNDGARSQIYTAPGQPTAADAYVELELLGRLHDLAAGQRASTRAVYTLRARSEADADAEARKVLPRPRR